MDQHLLIEEHDGLLEVVLNRPAQLNALSDAMVDRLRQAVELFSDRPALRVMLIRATGRYFCAGAEISADISPAVGSSTLDGRTWYRKKWHRLFDDLESIEKPVVVAHHGPCLGGGLELSLSCDFRLAARSARYGLPEIDIGALPGSGGISRLTRIVGPHWARWLAMAGEQVDAERALTMGLLHDVYADDEFEARVRAFCSKLSGYSYEALGLAKLSIELAADLGRAEGRNVERISNSILFTGGEHKALVDRFVQAQAAKRRARQPKPEAGGDA